MIAVPALMFGIYYGYNQFDTWRTSQKFTNLEQDIDALKSELEKQGIQELSKNKYCLRDGEKFGGGKMRCSIILSATLQKNNNEDPFSIDMIDGVIRMQDFVRNEEIERFDKISHGTYSHQELACRLTLTDENIENRQFEFYCIDAVNKPIYPVTE